MRLAREAGAGSVPIDNFSKDSARHRKHHTDGSSISSASELSVDHGEQQLADAGGSSMYGPEVDWNENYSYDHVASNTSPMKFVRGSNPSSPTFQLDSQPMMMVPTSQNLEQAQSSQPMAPIYVAGAVNGHNQAALPPHFQQHQLGYGIVPHVVNPHGHGHGHGVHPSLNPNLNYVVDAGGGVSSAEYVGMSGTVPSGGIHGYMASGYQNAREKEYRNGSAVGQESSPFAQVGFRRMVRFPS